jgi:GTPase-associated adaptor domain
VEPGRRLVYRFFSLPHQQRMAVIDALGLAEPDDGGVSDMERFRRFFRRAREQSLLAGVWREVEALHPDGDTTSNPFGAA